MKTQAEFERGWTPIRRGNAYCSPRCGMGCTHAAFNSATRSAAALCGRLGPGWEPRVWENCGWHWEVQKGFATVKQERDGTYACWLEVRDDNTFYGVVPQIIIDGFKSPEDAVGTAVQMARTFALRLSADCNRLLD